MNKIKGIPYVSGKTIWYQFNRKANVYKKRNEVILGENRESSNNGKKLKNSKSKDLDKFNSIIHLDLSNYNLLIQKFKNISTIVISRSMENKTNYPFAISLGDTFRTFNDCCEKIKSKLKIIKLIAKQKLDIQEFITKNVQTIWSNFPESDKFTKDSYEEVSSFEETVGDLLSKISQIESLFKFKNLHSEKFNK